VRGRAAGAGRRLPAFLPIRFHLHRNIRKYPELFARARSVLDAVGLAGEADEAVRNLSHGDRNTWE
jgi:hypothetical protein